MAKANKSADQSAPPAPAVPVASPAPARRSVSPEDVKFEQEARDGLLSLAEAFSGFGGAEEPDEDTAGKVTKDKGAPPAAPKKGKADKTQTAQEDDDAPVLGGDDDEDGPVLSEDDDADEDEDAAAAGAADDDDDNEDDASPEGKAKALEKRNFKLREQKRELREQYEAARREADELRSKVERLESLPTGAAESGPFAEAKTEAEIAAEETRLRSFVEWMDDLLDDRQEIYILKDASGQEQEYDRSTIRQWKKQAQASLSAAAPARANLKKAAEADAYARKKFPFVFDPKSKFNAVVLDLVEETPALNKLPNKAVLLGRLSVGKLVESGQFMLVPKGAKAKAAAAPVKAATSPATPPVRRAPDRERRPDLMERALGNDKDALLEFAAGLVPDA